MKKSEGRAVSKSRGIQSGRDGTYSAVRAQCK